MAADLFRDDVELIVEEAARALALWVVKNRNRNCTEDVREVHDRAFKEALSRLGALKQQIREAMGKKEG